MEKVQRIFPPRIDLLRSDEGQLKPSNRASVVGSTLAAGVGAIRESRSKEPLHPAEVKNKVFTIAESETRTHKMKTSMQIAVRSKCQTLEGMTTPLNKSPEWRKLSQQKHSPTSTIARWMFPNMPISPLVLAGHLFHLALTGRSQGQL